LTVSTVDNAPRTVITGINATFVAIAHNMVQPNLSSTGSVGVAHEPTDASSRMVNSSSSNNNNNRITANMNDSRVMAIFNDNLGKPGSADAWATSHLGTEDCAISWATKESAGKYVLMEVVSPQPHCQFLPVD